MATAGLDYDRTKGDKMKVIVLLLVFMVSINAGRYDKVKITPEISYMYVYHKGKAVKVHRIQNTKNKLTGQYAMTYRPDQDIQHRLKRGSAPGLPGAHTKPNPRRILPSKKPIRSPNRHQLTPATGHQPLG